MKNIIKTLIVMLTSISLFASANAGELGVSGTAKATYNIQSDTAKGKALGITNELNFTASGELDNGYTWSYSMELDPGAANAAGTAQGTTGENQDAQNDDTKLTMTTPYGTVGVFISEGGLDKEDGASQSVYARPTDVGDPSSGAGDNYTIDAYNNVQFHTPADLLPFSTSFKIAYAPDLHAYGSGDNAGAQIDKSGTGMGRSATEYQVTMAPIDGLAMGASYIEFDGSGIAKIAQKPESGSAFATYAYGPFSFGLSKALKSPIAANSDQTSTTQVDYYDQTNYSVSYAVNDDLSLSYEMEEDKKILTHDSMANVKQESSAIQAAYTMGGMTLAISRGSYDNAGYVQDTDVNQTLFAVTMAF